MSRIFISYRRDDTSDASARLYERLADRFGRENIFKDVDNIPLGVDFRQILRAEVARCDVMLVVIGRFWLARVGRFGRRRLDDPHDFVRIEVESALAAETPVVPVLVQGTSLPKRRELPKSLGDLAARQGLEVRSDPYFHRDMDLLIGRLNLILGAPSDSTQRADATSSESTAVESILPMGSILAGRYIIKSFLGESTRSRVYSRVFHAHDTTFDREVAIEEALDSDASTREQVKLEAEFLSSVHHPNLLHGYSSFEEEGKPYLVTEYVEGMTLEDVAIEYIRRTARALPEARVLEWMIPVCEAVHALHTQPIPIIHRNIKPSNIKLRRSEQSPVLLDLKIAALYVPNKPLNLATLAYSPGYAPPEQYSGEATDQRTDIYALGATLYFLLTGYQPTDAPSRQDMGELRTPRALNLLLSSESDEIVLRSLALNPSERYQTAQSLAEALREALTALKKVLSSQDL